MKDNSKANIIARSKEFRDLTEEEKSIVCNGCGSRHGINVPDLIFRDACDLHDYMYSKGGKEKDRSIADKEFLSNMLKKARRNLFYRTMAYIYYTAVKVGGRFCFNYDSNISSDSSESKHEVI